ncbi:MAG TPA: hypothetical protein VK695_14730 [Steroidobacteraceae bacterium]|jgi:hypothetical protein|nr:hypothetical protein [Steroidobacteraceae bacterium]
MNTNQPGSQNPQGNPQNPQKSQPPGGVDPQRKPQQDKPPGGSKDPGTGSQKPQDRDDQH